MQVMKIHTWLDAGEALKMIELLDAMSAALMEQHVEGIKEILRGQPAEESDQQQLPLEDTGAF